MKNESGITLVELLAALSILSVVILLAGSIHMFGQRQFVHQRESAEAANDLSYALNVMTTDLRKQSKNNVDYEPNKIVIFSGQADEITYVVDTSNHQLKRNQTVIAEPVHSMVVEQSGTDIGLDITLTSSLSNATQKEYQTTVVFRRLTEK